VTSVLLAGYAAAAGFGGPALLRRDWPAHAPRLAILAWLALSASCVAAAVLAAVALAVPVGLSWSGGMGGPSSATPGGPAVAAAWLLLAAAILARAAWCLARALARSQRERRAHAVFLATAGRADHELGAVVLDQDVPDVYCLPGGGGRVVVSSGALAALGPGQLRAALAHERAHLRGRHHAVLTWAAALGRAFPMVPLLAQADPQLAALAEMAADDVAARRHPPGDLAAALVTLARARARATAHDRALTAGGPAAIARVQRLLAPPAPGRAAWLAAVLALIPPALIALLLLGVAACGVTPHR
jgi:Zn-dependent protease with chaperone function